MLRPVILAVDADPRELAAVERELSRRYAGDYAVVCRRSAREALDLLRQLGVTRVDVALVLADSRQPDMGVLEFFREAGSIAPHAKRVMLADRGDAGAVDTAVTGADLTAGERRELWPLARPPLPLETSRPGVSAAGDVRHGSLQRVVAAASDGALAVRSAHEFLMEARAAAGDEGGVT